MKLLKKIKKTPPTPPITPTPPIEQRALVIRALRGVPPVCRAQVVDVIYSREGTERYIILRDGKGSLSYVLETIEFFGDEERKHGSEAAEALPAGWVQPCQDTHRSVFSNIDELMKELYSQPHYKQYFGAPNAYD